MNNTPIFILYHSNCLDGSGAALAAYMHFQDNENLNLIPVQYNKPLPKELLEYKELSKAYVYIVDFSYSRDILDELEQQVAHLQVIDHHKTAQEALKCCSYAIFDMHKSGAVLTYEFFNPGKEVPLFFKLISDRDLWKWEYSETKDFCSALDVVDKNNFEEWVEAFKSFQEDPEAFLKEGSVVSKYKNVLVKKAARTSKIVIFKGYKVPILNATNFISEIGSYLNESLDPKHPFSISYFITNANEAVLSFRSRKGEVDVEVLAKELGGGGHASAAGATVSIEKLQEILNNTAS